LPVAVAAGDGQTAEDDDEQSQRSTAHLCQPPDIHN